MKYFTYILLCDEKTFYVGVASNLDKRVQEHKNKLSNFTKKFSIIRLVYYEDFLNLVLARRREKQLKGWTSAKKKALIKNNKTLLVNLSKST